MGYEQTRPNGIARDVVSNLITAGRNNKKKNTTLAQPRRNRRSPEVKRSRRRRQSDTSPRTGEFERAL